MAGDYYGQARITAMGYEGDKKMGRGVRRRFSAYGLVHAIRVPMKLADRKIR